MASESPVLVVDDDRDIRDSLVDILEDHGFKAITAANGLEALKVLRSMTAPPLAILLDLMMPVMDGYGFVEEHKKDPVLASIPVAIISAGRGVDSSRLGNHAPILPKPINVPHLVGILRGFRSGAQQ